MISIPLANPTTLLGYIGPGSGISLLGPLLGVLLAVVGALVMVAFWPIRLLIKRVRSSSSAHSIGAQATSASEAND